MKSALLILSIFVSLNAFADGFECQPIGLCSEVYIEVDNNLCYLANEIPNNGPAVVKRYCGNHTFIGRGKFEIIDETSGAVLYTYQGYPRFLTKRLFSYSYSDLEARWADEAVTCTGGYYPGDMSPRSHSVTLKRQVRWEGYQSNSGAMSSTTTYSTRHMEVEIKLQDGRVFNAKADGYHSIRTRGYGQQELSSKYRSYGASFDIDASTKGSASLELSGGNNTYSITIGQEKFHFNYGANCTGGFLTP